MKVRLVKCPQCGRKFADQMTANKGYVFPVHVMNPAREKRERYQQCPGSGAPITRDYRVAA